MDADDKPVLIYATFPSIETAETVGRMLVERRLVACVNLLPGMISIYTWNDVLAREAECAAILKTRASLAEEAITAARWLHPYENPAFLILPVTGGSADFIAWIERQTASP